MTSQFCTLFDCLLSAGDAMSFFFFFFFPPPQEEERLLTKRSRAVIPVWTCGIPPVWITSRCQWLLIPKPAPAVGPVVRTAVGPASLHCSQAVRWRKKAQQLTASPASPTLLLEVAVVTRSGANGGTWMSTRVLLPPPPPPPPPLSIKGSLSFCSLQRR